eukprot:3313939-Lingulodinium_polyedra.AAC.1
MGYALSSNPDNASTSMPAATHISLQLRDPRSAQGTPKMSVSAELSMNSRGSIVNGFFDALPVR